MDDQERDSLEGLAWQIDNRPATLAKVSSIPDMDDATAFSGRRPKYEPKISCRGIWKVFGKEGTAIMRRLSEKSTAENTDAFLRNARAICAVQNVTLDIYPGEIFVIMGLSGSGKSTLVRCMSRLLEPTAGSVLIDGVDLLAMNSRDLVEIRRHKFGMVFQQFALLPYRTVLGNVAFPLEVQGVDRAVREERAREMIDLVGLNGREAYYPRELSGGQQQRVGIARSIAVEPDLWFLDEPFSALDPLIRREMQDEFLRLQRMLRKTIVFVTHDFDEAIRLADRIAIMKDGAIVQIGPPEELVLHPKTEYIAAFTRDVSRAKVLSVGSIMRPVQSDAPVGSSKIRVTQRVVEIAKSVVSSATPVSVVDDDDIIVGELHATDVLDVLVN